MVVSHGLLGTQNYGAELTGLVGFHWRDALVEGDIGLDVLVQNPERVRGCC